MRFSLPILRRLSDALRKRDWFGIGFELFVVIIGVMLGMAASRWAAERDERQYHNQMVSALTSTLMVYVDAGGYIDRQIEKTITDYRHQVAAGERRAPPFWRLEQLERPPTLAWDAMVATGIARSLDAELVFKIARFFSRGDGWGDRYQRYNTFTEQQILPYVETPARFYGRDGELLPLYVAHIERLRELQAVNKEMVREASQLRQVLQATQ